MKVSRYNIHFSYRDKGILYNSLSDEFMVLESVFLALVLGCAENENNIAQLKEFDPFFYHSLIKQGFLVNKNKNELEEIKRISQATDFDESSYELTINPTMNCNFKCWYCYETHIKKSTMSEQTMQSIQLFIENVLQRKNKALRKFILNWFGGEPLLYFHKTVLPLLQWTHAKMQANNIEFGSGFTSNGLLITQDLLDECKKYGVHHFQITLDGHRNRHNQVRYVSKTRGSYDKIVENIKLCAKNGIQVLVRINISEETVADLLKIIPDFDDLNVSDKDFLSFSFHEVWQEEKDLSADISTIVAQYRQHGLTTNYMGEQSLSIRHSCYADKLNQATINYNGDVFKCTARDYISDNREGVLTENGNIQWNTIFDDRMIHTRFQNQPCLECKILPICNGGCSQHRIENKNTPYCIHHFDEHKKMQIVKEKFYTRMHYSDSQLREFLQ